MKKLVKLKIILIFFSNTSNLNASYLYNYFEKNLSLKRFDNICLGVQTFLENQLVKWVKNCIKKTKINTLVLGGGVFMNVKESKNYDFKRSEKTFCIPILWRQSLSMGAAC